MAKILMVVPALYCCGGLQKISLQLSSELIKKGHDVTVVDTYEPNTALIDNLEHQPRFHKLSSYEISSENVSDLVSIVNSNCVELIIYQGFFLRVNIFLEKFHQVCNVPIVSVYHNSPDASLTRSAKDIEDNGLKRLLKYTFWPVYKQYSLYKVGKFLRLPALLSESIVLLSNKYIEPYKHLAHLNISPKVIPNFIPGKPIENLTGKKKQIIYVGRLEESLKRVLRSIKIWERIATKLPDWEFKIAGEGRCRKKYEDYIKARGIPRITLLGNLKNPSQLYEESSILMLTSDKEGFPLVLAEAMLRGCVPVVYDSYFAASDIIDDNVDGILVEPFDEDEFCNKVMTLAQDKDMRDRLAMNAIKKGLNYQPDKILSKWEEIIRNYCQ